MISKELVAASTQPLVLALLAKGESYGYELIQKVGERSGGQLEWSEGMLYPFLHWMEDQGLIESRWKESDSGRRRKYYRLSKTGTQALKTDRENWLAVHNTLTKLWNSRNVTEFQGQKRARSGC